MRKTYFHGYTFYEDGTIIGLYGREIKKVENKGYYEIKLVVNGKRKTFSVARLMYNLFVGFDIDNKNLCVLHKDNNRLNVHIDNLYLEHRKNIIQGSKHDSISKLTQKQVEEIKELYKGSAGINQHDKKGLSMNDLAEKYNVSKGSIQMILKGWVRNKDNYKL